jgi:5'-deoxynucleotidase
MKLVNLLAFCRGLASVKRYSMETMSRDESVLEHTGFVVLVCYAIGRKIELSDADMGRLLVSAACHDVDEVLTGDVARPVKYHSPVSRNIFVSIAAEGLERLRTGLGIDLAGDHAAAKQGRLGLIVAVADVLAVVYKMWDEVLMRGNLSLTRYSRVRDQLSKLGIKICAEWQDHNDRAFVLGLLDQGAEIAREVGSRSHRYVVTLREDYQG